jgi:hypothetical protein
MRAVVSALIFILAAPALAQQGRALQHDPFARPSPGALPGMKPAPGPRRVPPPAPPKLKLHGVMMAGPDSIANVEGSMVRIGESIQGYRLVAVHERAAVFEKDSATFTVAVGASERK